jgi:hypothetical protein
MKNDQLKLVHLFQQLQCKASVEFLYQIQKYADEIDYQYKVDP